MNLNLILCFPFLYKGLHVTPVRIFESFSLSILSMLRQPPAGDDSKNLNLTFCVRPFWAGINLDSINIVIRLRRLRGYKMTTGSDESPEAEVDDSSSMSPSSSLYSGRASSSESSAALRCSTAATTLTAGRTSVFVL